MFCLHVTIFKDNKIKHMIFYKFQRQMDVSMSKSCIVLIDTLNHAIHRQLNTTKKF